MSDPQTADLVAKMVTRTSEPVHRRALLSLLARRLGGDWNSASTHPEIMKAIEQTLSDPITQLLGVALAVATRDRHYQQKLRTLAEDLKTSEGSRIAAVEGLGSFPDSSQEVFERLIQSVRGKASSNATAEAAVRAIGKVKNDGKPLIALLSAPDFPLGLRRERFGAWHGFVTVAARFSTWPIPASFPQTSRTSRRRWSIQTPTGRFATRLQKSYPCPRRQRDRACHQSVN